MEELAMGKDWTDDLERWLEPLLNGLGHKARRRICPAYIAGSIGPGDRKSIQPMAARDDAISYDRLHHFISAGLWDSKPLEAALWQHAEGLDGGEDAWLIIDDTALPKEGTSSVGVAPQYASALGKRANRQTLVPTTLASGEVPVMLSLRLFLPENWTDDDARMAKAGVPQGYRQPRTKPEIVIQEIDRIIAADVRFGCALADSGYGLSASFRQALSTLELRWAVGIPEHQKVYPADVELVFPVAGRGRPRQRHVPACKSIAAHLILEGAKWRQVSWRRDTKGRLVARFAAMRVRIADGPPQRIGSMGSQQMPGDQAWLVGEHRSNGERKYYLEPSHRYADQDAGWCHQGPLDLRAGPSATQRRTGARPLRRPIMYRPAPTCAHANDRLRLPPIPPLRSSGAGKKNRRPAATAQLASSQASHPQSHLTTSAEPVSNCGYSLQSPAKPNLPK